jgi:hypothetical protein
MIDESSLMAMQMAAIQCVQEELSTLRAECDALRERAAAAEAESEALLSVLERVKPNIHIDAARTADAASVAPSATDVLFPGAA